MMTTLKAVDQMDWSLDENRRKLRIYFDGLERNAAKLFPDRSSFLREYYRGTGIGQFTYKGFIDWFVENYPYEAAELWNRLVENQ